MITLPTSVLLPAAAYGRDSDGLPRSGGIRVGWDSPLGQVRGFLALTVTGLLVAGLSACLPPSVLGLRHDPSFTYQSLDSSIIAVGGVTRVTDGEAPAAATPGQRDSLLNAALTNGYHRLKVLPTHALVATVGAELHDELLTRYRVTGELDSAALQGISERLPDLRYIVLARIEADRTDSSETVEEDTPGKRQVTHSTSRSLIVGFQVYDLPLSRAVWSGRLAKHGSESNTYGEPKGILNALATVLLGLDSYPDPPAEIEVLRLVFEAFAKNLPQPPKR